MEVTCSSGKSVDFKQTTQEIYHKRHNLSYSEEMMRPRVANARRLCGGGRRIGSLSEPMGARRVAKGGEAIKRAVFQ
jgi:hypothetical protein